MPPLQMDVLRMLRIFGPCSNAEVGRRLKIAPDKTYPALQKLVESGHAVHPKLQRWDITPLGKAEFERMPFQGLHLFNPESV